MNPAEGAGAGALWAEFCGAAGAAPNVKVGAGAAAEVCVVAPKAGAAEGAVVFPKPKPVELLPNAGGLGVPNVGAAVLAGTPNVNGAGALVAPLAPNVKGFAAAGA